MADAQKRPGTHAVHPRWWGIEDPTRLADEVCAINDGLEEDQSPRRERYLRDLCRYEGRALNGFNAAAYDSPAKGSFSEDIRLPLYRALCDTVQADIAGRQRPKPMFLTSGADWKTRRRAKKMDRLVEAVLHAPHGTYYDGWELANDVMVDAAALGVTGIKVFIDRITEELVLERVLPGRVKVDPREAECGKPKNWFDSYLMDVDQAIEEFVECRRGMSEDEGGLSDEEADKLRDAILEAAVTDDAIKSQIYGTTRIAQSVKIREAWRSPISKKKPGVHVYCLPGVLLWKEEWHRDGPGIVWLRWSRERLGFWGVGLIEQAETQVEEANAAARHLQQRMSLLGNRRTWVHDNTEVNEADLEANEIENIIRYAGTQPPTETDLPPFHGAELDYKREQVRDVFDLQGVPQGTATARKEQGITAGVAIRMVRDMGTQRQSIKARAFENMFPALAMEIVTCIAEWCDATGRDYTAKLPRKTAVDEIRWSQAKMDLNGVMVRVQPVSSLPRDAAGIMATVGELFQQGVISESVYLGLLDWPDLDKVLQRKTAQAEYLERLVEKYMDAEPEDIQPGFFENPDGFLPNKPEAMLQLALDYLTHKCEGAPEFNLELLRRYMMRLDRLMQAATPAPNPGAAMPAAPPLPAGGPPPPGMGPGVAAPPNPMAA